MIFRNLFIIFIVF